MITSLPNRIIKHGTEIEIKQFVLPDRSDDRPFKPVVIEETQPPLERETSVSDAVDGAGEEASQILLKANQLAASILKEAEEQARQMKKNAITEGFQEGYEQGVCQGKKQAEEELEKFKQQEQEQFEEDMAKALESIDRAKESCMRTYLEELKECSVAIAEKVVHISLRSSGEIIKRMLIAETEKLKKRAWVKIYMEKADYDMMTEADADIVNELAKLSDNIKFVVMEKGNSGSCILEMPDEIVDISVDTQMDNIREILGNIRF